MATDPMRRAHDLRRRVVGYGLVAVAAGALVWAGWLRTAEADFGTLLGSAEVHVRLASSMPARDGSGSPVAAREQLLDQAEEYLRRADAVARGNPLVGELGAMIRYLRGAPAEAAAQYARTRALPECSATQRSQLAINEARMHLLAGQPAQALALVAPDGPITAADQDAAAVERMRALQDLGRRDAALALARQLADSTTAEVPYRLAAAETCERLGEAAAAERIYTGLHPAAPAATYGLARLKIAQGAADTALELLETAFARDARQTRALVRADERLWLGLAPDARFQKVFGARAAAARPGR